MTNQALIGGFVIFIHMSDILDRGEVRMLSFWKLECKAADRLECGLCFFGKGIDYYGVDINVNCRQFEKLEENIHILVVDQSSSTSLTDLMKKIPPPDIIIDDGSHIVSHQNITFNHLFSFLKTGGVYLIEDLHTSYWAGLGGTSDRHCKNKTMIEESKKWIDILNLNHFDKSNPMTRDKDWLKLHSEMGGLMFYNSMVFIEKTVVPSFDRVMKGDHWIPVTV